VWNFALDEWWAFEGAATSTGRGRRFVMFWAVNMAALALRGPILALLTSVFHIHYLISNLISLGVLVVLRFAIADSLIWGNTASSTDPIAPDDLFAHVPRDVAEDLGWVLNPVAEAAEVGRRTDGENPTDGPGPEIEPGPEARGEETPIGPTVVDPPRYGSIIPPTTTEKAPETGRHTAVPASLRLVRSVDRPRGRRRH
jgi:hypothetical protein